MKYSLTLIFLSLILIGCGESLTYEEVIALRNQEVITKLDKVDMTPPLDVSFDYINNSLLSANEIKNENVAKEINGEVIEILTVGRLSVKRMRESVGKGTKEYIDGDIQKYQIKSDGWDGYLLNTRYTIELYTLDEKQKSLIENIESGDSLLFKGKVSKIKNKDIFIEDALLIEFFSRD
jgi:hypothetical protein